MKKEAIPLDVDTLRLVTNLMNLSYLFINEPEMLIEMQRREEENNNDRR